MHLFISEEEFAEIKDDAEALALRADDYIRRLIRQVDNEKARAEAAQINAEQTCSLIEQKYLAVAGENANMEKEKAELVRVSEQRAVELVEAKAEVHRLQLDAIKHGSDLERSQLQVSELHAARRELLDLIERKNAELEEKNAAASSYLAKIVSLTNERSDAEAKHREERAELTRCQTLQVRLEQEKDLLQQHNTWLRDELSSKTSFALEERHRAGEVEADLKAKLAEAEKLAQEKNDAAIKLEGRLKESQAELERVRQDLRDLKQESLHQAEQFEGELSSAMTLVELYKESSEEWSGKANELEGVVKALETHIKQQEKDFEEKLQGQLGEAETAVKEAEAARARLEAELAEVRDAAKRPESFLPSSASPESAGNLLVVRRTGNEDVALAGVEPPRLVGEFSSTALAAMLLRDGWSLAKTYGRMVEVEDAWRHEKQKRLEAEHCLEMILYQIEEKAGAIREERAEQQRLQRAYSTLQAKLEDSALIRERLEQELRESKAELDARKREIKAAGKVVEDLQMQNVRLFEEIEVLQEVAEGVSRGDLRAAQALGLAWIDKHNGAPDLATLDIFSGRQARAGNIRDLVVENTELKSMCARLNEENKLKDEGIKELHELQHLIEQQEKHMEETNRRLQESTETAKKMQESTAMFKRLYEEEAQARRSALTPGGGGELMLVPAETYHGDGGDYRKLLGDTKAELQKLREDTKEQNAMTKAELDKAREEASSARIDRTKAELEAQHYKEQLDLIRNEARDLRRELESSHRRSLEYSSLITTYQSKLREAQEAVHAAEEKERQSSFAASVLEREKALLADAERKVSQEVSQLSDKLHRMQASYENIQQTQEAREATRAEERKRLEDELKRLQVEWADGRRELEFERTRIRELTAARDRVAEEAAARVDLALKAAEDAKAKEAAAETRARLAEARCEDLEANLKKADDKVTLALTGGNVATIATPESGAVDRDAELMAAVMLARREAEVAKEAAAADKEHAKQWKIIAERNEEAMKMSDDRHQAYKEEVEKAMEAREAEVASLRQHATELQAKIAETTADFKKTIDEKNAALQAAIEEHAKLKEGNAKISRELADAQEKLEVLQKDAKEYHGRWRDEHANFERQVTLQAATIEELKLTSAKLEKVGAESEQWHARAEKAEGDLASLRVQWEAEVASLQSEKEGLLKKIAELENQNQLLLDRMEAMHILAAEDARKQAAEAGEKGVEKVAREVSAEDGLQEVVRYLRRSKQAADTELSLLKQERARLQKQLEGANRALEDAQTRIRDFELKASARVHSDDEFAKLQAKIGQVGLLEQSNNILREENQENLHASEEWRRKAEGLQKELEPLRAKLLEKEIEVNSCRPEITRLEDEAKRWHRRVNELLEKYRTVDLEEHQRVKDELASMKAGFEKAQHDRTSAQQSAAASMASLEALKSGAEVAEEKVKELSTALDEMKEQAEGNAKKMIELTQEVAKLNAEKETFKDVLEEENAKGRRAFTKERVKVMEQEAKIASLETDKLALEAAQAEWEAARASMMKDLEEANSRVKAAEDAKRAAAATLAQRPIPAQAVKKGLADKKAAAESAKKQAGALQKHKEFLTNIVVKAKERGDRLHEALDLWQKEFDEWKATKNKADVDIPEGLLTEQQIQEDSTAYRSLLAETEMISQQDPSEYAEETPAPPLLATTPAEATGVVVPDSVKAVAEASAPEPEATPLQPKEETAVVPAPSSAIIVAPPPASALPVPIPRIAASRPPSATSSASLPSDSAGGAATTGKQQEQEPSRAATAEQAKPTAKLVAENEEERRLRERAMESLLSSRKAVAETQERKKARKINRDPIDINVDAPAPENFAPGPTASTGDVPLEAEMVKPSRPWEPLQASPEGVAPTILTETPVTAGMVPEAASLPGEKEEEMAEASAQPNEVKSEAAARLLKRPRESTSEDTDAGGSAEGAPKTTPSEADMAGVSVGTPVTAFTAPSLPTLTETDLGVVEAGEMLATDDPASKRPKLSALKEETSLQPGPEQTSEPMAEDETVKSAAAVEREAVGQDAPQEVLTEVIGGEMATDGGEEVVSPAPPGDMAMQEAVDDAAGNVDAMMHVETDEKAAEAAPESLPTLVSSAGFVERALVETHPVEEALQAMFGGTSADMGTEPQSAPGHEPTSAPLTSSGMTAVAGPVDVSESAGGQVMLHASTEADGGSATEQTPENEGEGGSGVEPGGLAAAPEGELIVSPEAAATAPGDETQQGDAAPSPPAPARIIKLGGAELAQRRAMRLQGKAQGAEVTTGQVRVTRSQAALPPNPSRLPGAEERALKNPKGGRGSGRGRGGDAAAAGGQNLKGAQRSRGRGSEQATNELPKEGESEAQVTEEEKIPPSSPPKTFNPYDLLEDGEE